MRKDAADIILQLSKLPVELTISTNAVRVDEFIDVFKRANIKSINVSLDTLNKEKFHTIAQRNSFDKVWSNINLLVENNFHVKINAVIMKGINENQIIPLLGFAFERNISIRFLEIMAMGFLHHNADKYLFTQEEILNTISAKYSFKKISRSAASTANYWQTADGSYRKLARWRDLSM